MDYALFCLAADSLRFKLYVLYKEVSRLPVYKAFGMHKCIRDVKEITRDINVLRSNFTAMLNPELMTSDYEHLAEDGIKQELTYMIKDMYKIDEEQLATTQTFNEENCAHLQYCRWLKNNQPRLQDRRCFLSRLKHFKGDYLETFLYLGNIPRLNTHQLYCMLTKDLKLCSTVLEQIENFYNSYNTE